MQILQNIPYPSRRDIFEIFEIRNITWYGALDQPEFLGRLFDLNALTSTDHRYSTAYQDIRKHTVHNHDWPDDWIAGDTRFKILSGPDEAFVQFLALTLHPRVRSAPAEHDILYDDFTNALSPFGWQFLEDRRIAGSVVYKAGRIGTGENVINSTQALAKKLDAAHFRTEINRINRAVSTDLGQAIGAAKDLLETTCFIILKERGEAAPTNPDLPKLVKAVTKSMKLTPDDINMHKKGATATRRILSSLPNLVQGIAELRNEYGAGHGKDGDHVTLERPTALLMVQSSLTLVTFLVDSHLNILNRK